MLMIARRRRIVEIVRRQKSVLVRDLARIVAVTEETIRKDLEQLESESKLMRSHGGAVLPEPPGAEVHFSERLTRNIREKRAIAAAAVKRVAEGETLMLDASSTVLEMARLIPDIRLTVITNSLQIQLELVSRKNLTLIVLGGILIERSLSTHGPQAERALEAYHADKAFISCKGIDPSGAVTESSELMTRVKQAMLQRSDRRFLLADHSKFGVKSLVTTARLDDMDEVITDAGTLGKALKLVQNKSAKVTVAK